ncbi:cytochrome bo3 quinol oxidase subunit 4 [Kushneria sinocarnis]|uniref:Cytochrome bo(3) ubiquinol oxidase subunit 4 n=1 Tax=Kushneria sinocarnis TaxID=595502 RepID=A0A420WTU4_9GAMM|nr:cytochrome o ubiquinol oxidase subunit IV [Kushneria sinocarnis]RKQ95921.1 cytochrome bo3 quinol oxidase subunit 4 [Kushneria sinocarnis]
MSDKAGITDAGSSGDHGHEGNLKTYVLGLIFSIVLTIIPFGMVMLGGFGMVPTVIVLAITAVLQVLVQLIMFLHMNTKSGEGWNMASFAFAVMVVGIVIVGSLWIMFHLNHFMMMSS